jgi:hypothetical protein
VVTSPTAPVGEEAVTALRERFAADPAWHGGHH